MKIYKFKDKIEGNFAFILAPDENAAWEELYCITALPCELVESKHPDEIKKPVVIFNNILPF